MTPNESKIISSASSIKNLWSIPLSSKNFIVLVDILRRTDQLALASLQTDYIFV